MTEPEAKAGHSPHDDWWCECGHPYLLTHEQGMATVVLHQIEQRRPEAATPDAAGLREALERLLRATEFPAYNMDGTPGSVRVSRTHLHPLIEAAEQARAALAADAGSVGALDVDRLARALHRCTDDWAVGHAMQVAERYRAAGEGEQK